MMEFIQLVDMVDGHIVRWKIVCWKQRILHKSFREIPSN